LRDVADIRRTFKDRTSYSRFNGRPSINIEVVKRLGSNIIETNKQVRKTVATFTASWPQVVKVDFALDQSKFIHEVLGSLQSAIMTAIALVMIVVVAALGPRSALMVGIAIPSSFMLGFLIIGLAGMTVNMMLMFGMVLTVGILVDGAIVIVEYADRKVAEGLSRRDAYIMSAKRMLWPIVSSTATTLAAFLPLLLWPGVSGEFMSYLPITVIFVLGASLVTAMIFLPVLGRWLGRKKIPETEKLAATHLSSGASVDYSDIRGAVGIYVRFLQTIVNWPLLVIITAAVIMGAIVFLFTKFAKGVEFFVDTEPEQAIVFVSARGNLSAEDKLVLVRKVEREIFAVGGYKAVLTSVTGKGSGPSDFSGAGVDTPVDQIGQGIIELKDFTKRRPGKEILHDIRERTNKIPGIVVEVRKREDGPPTGKDVRLQIGGNERLIVEQVTRRVRRHFENMEGLRDIEDTTPLPGIEWVLDVDRKEAGRFGADVTSVGAMIQLVTNGLLIGTYRPDDSEDEVDIRLRFPGADRSIDQLDQLRVIGEQGQVPLVNFVNRQARPLVSSITRLDGSFSMSVKANTVEGILPDSKIGEIDAWLKSQEWPRGIEFRFRGADEEQREAGAFLGKAMVAALFIMFIILLTQFDSFYQTFITLSTIVMSMVGVLLGMLITGQTFSIIMTGTGVIALAGIVVNNSIVLIDTYNHLRYDVGLRGVDAVLKASAQRLRPVLLTTVTTICGLLPMALQINMDFINRYIQIGSITSIWWVQLSTAVIFGLGFATMLTLIITPTLLAMPTVYKDAFRRRAARKT
jgi:multidrug efflux pump